MDDFTLNVRQISQYPPAQVQPSDLVLIQQGGLGGPYASATTRQVVLGGSTSANDQIAAANFVVPLNGHYSWSNVGALSFAVDGWDFLYTSTQFATSLLHLHVDGLMQLPFNTLRVARDPFEPFEVATANYVTNNTVSSFNGRNGAVNLTGSDVDAALEVRSGDAIATQSWVNAVLCQSIPDFIYRNPFVYTWNGRVGDVQLTLADVEKAFFAQPGVYPTAPSPALGDASSKIATTAFVDESLEEWASEINSSWNAADFELLNILQTQYAPLNSPQFTGDPTGPTAPPGSSTGQLATTAFVTAAITASTTGVVSFNTRTGAVVFTAADLTSVGGAFINSPSFTGTPTTTVPPASDNSNKIPTTSWVLDELAAISAGVTSWNGRSGIVLMTAADVTTVGGALLASPAFTGNPTAPTQLPGTSNTTLATTAFVMTNAGVASWNGRTGAVSLQANDISAVGGALLASPAFTGTPTAPTAPPNTSTTQLATTAFVMGQLASANVVSSFNTRTGAVVLTAADVSGVGGALLFQGTSPPASPTTQMLWWDTTGGQLYVYTGTVWAAASAGL